jgi:lipid-A-disaccharide synthase
MKTSDSTMQKTIMIVAGEASGDLYGGGIAGYIHNTDRNIRCIGMGSSKMRDAGVELLYDSAGIAVVGILEVLTHWPEIKRALRTLEDYIPGNKPDLLILIDYQEFNLRLARFAKQHGVKVLFYISPQVWAWRQGRLKKFVDRIDMMAVIFPFEVKYFTAAKIPVRYTGHPLCNKVAATASRHDTLDKYGLTAASPVIGLLPGSRRSEIQRILPILLETAKRLRTLMPGAQFLLPVAGSSLLPQIQDKLRHTDLDIKTCIDDTYNAINSCDAAMVASGTATLETALLNVPMAVVYRLSPISHAILRRLISIPLYSLVNIIAGKEIVREFIQDQASPDLIAGEIVRLIDDKFYRNQVTASLQSVRQELGDTDGIEGIAELALQMLHS